ncbi:hypothetical protein C9994_05605 [Marivirga lumbricoides]|uniref:Gingipain domain-containing protein n=1 Tax=Marivirga lumbricoides TaxID=1046115 RepID=A0A2T4DSU7_9BACT|nr:hypothetical protein C9994_05605 [Marivirga lumbricoides]
MRYRFLFILISLFSLEGKAQSVLNKQGLIKIATFKEGVYKIDRNFLIANSLNPEEIDPHKVKIYGMRGGHIPQANAIEYPSDPTEIPVQVDANENTTFEADEVLFFYSDAVKNIDYDFEAGTYIYSNNLYSDSLYFYIDFFAEDISLQLSTYSTIATTEGLTPINWYEEVAFHELDANNRLESGREWFGESFTNNRTRDFVFEMDGDLANNKQLHLRSAFLVESKTPTSLKISLNNLQLANLSLPLVSGIAYDLEGHVITEEMEVSTSLLAGTALNVTLTFENGGEVESEGYLDNLFLTLPLQLKYNNRQIVLRNREIQQAGIYNISIANITNHSIWDISNPLQTKAIDHQAGSFTTQNPGNEKEIKFVVFDKQSAFIPTFIGGIEAQNLKNNTNPDYVIITAPKFKAAANELATYRRSFNKFSVEVATTKAIFNEFGSGRRDISAIRNYIKYLYQNGGGKLKYVLMMGAASYDYKDRVNNNSNFVPIYQSRNSLHPVFTYASDDFYGLLDENEGEWQEVSNNVDDIDIGIGRIPCKTLVEARNVVKKIIHYETNPSTFRKWRNEIYFIGDDGDGNRYQQDSEQLSDYVASEYGFFNINKLYLGAFEQEVLASTEKSPKMNEAIDKMIEKGALIVNYIGHGSEFSWADESILNRDMISQWQNRDKLPLFVTATCEFGRHDNPEITSGAQVLILKKGAGAIGLLTTARPVFSNSNYKLNESFYNSVFDRVGNTPQKLGDIIRLTKNNGLDGVNNRNFILMGDPALTLAEPMHQVRVTEIVNTEGATDTLKSMSKISVSGEIYSFNNQKLNDFNGIIIAELFDKPVRKKTFERNASELIFTNFESVLYRGKATVVNGEFFFTFYMPKNLNYKLDQGKFSFYAYPDKGIEDANGFYNDFVVGGSDSIIINDNEGPIISAFMDNYNFQNRDKVGSDATLMIQLFDEHGISISSNDLDNGIAFALDEEEPVELNDFFYYNKDSYQQGEVNYNLRNMEGGWHNLKLQAKDVFNNASESNIEFFVVDNEQLEIMDFIVYPNPAKELSNFSISQNRKNDEVEVLYSIADSYGKIVYEQSFVTTEQQRTDTWNLSTANGSKVSPGLYFIRIFVRSLEDQSKTQQIKKLIVIN